MRWKAFYLVAFAAAFTAGGAALQKPEPPPSMPPAPEDALKRLPDPNDAVTLAFADAQRGQANGFDMTLIRYIWIQDGAPETEAAVRNALAIISRNSYLPVAPEVRIGDVVLLRVDLNELVPQQDASFQDKIDFVRFWEDLAFDPSFSLLLTKDTLRFAHVAIGDLPKIKKQVKRTVTKKVPFKRKERKQVKVPNGTPFLGADGKYYQSMKYEEQEVEVDDVRDEEVEVVEEVEVGKLDEVDVVRLNSRAIDPEAFVGLQTLLHTEAPVASDGYFLSRGLSTIKDAKVNGVFATIYGGRYYDFRGIQKAKKGTDLDLFLANLGVGFIGKQEQLTADELFDRLRSDQRVGIFHSGVTGKQRRVDLFTTAEGKEGRLPMVTITHDFKDAQVDIGTSPIANLLRVKADALEVIAVTGSGALIYALFDDKEALLDEAAADVVADRSIPGPYTTRLQSAISCIRCHGAKGLDGWQSVPNDVTTLLKSGFTPFLDLSDESRSRTDQLDRLRGLYTGDFTKWIQRARDDQAEVQLRAGGILWKNDPTGVEAVTSASQRIADRYNAYNFSTVGPADALHDLGLFCPPGKALETLRKVLPPVADPNQAVVPEDPRLAGLLSGVPIGVHDWQLVRDFAAGRARPNIVKMFQNPPPN